MHLPGRWSRATGPLVPFLFLLLGAGSPAAAQRAYRVELSAAGGYHIFDNRTDLASTIGGALRLGLWVSGPLSLEVEGSYAYPHTDTPLRQRVGVTTLSGWALANLPVGNATFIILKAGYGRTGYGSCPAVSVPGSGPCGAAGSLQAGAGIRISLSPTLFMRYEAIINRSLTTLKFSNYAIQGGLSLMLGSHPLVDTDGDGVYDRHDDCPGTPLGALVDRHGCPTDHDGDGVPDGLDRCPLTPPDAAVDPAGCSKDSDGDGVLDGLDQCPDTPSGAVVDQHGCPSDSDGDGVYDGLDRCPNTPAGATVDALGCAGDTDGDGVPDGLDLCPDTHLGVAVDDRGCPVTPEPAPDTTGASVQREWIVPGEVWKYRGWSLAPEAYPILDSVVSVMKTDPTTQAEVDGYAHDRLVPVDNTRLSQRRAEVVRAYIVSKGIGLGRVTAVGRGSETLLVADTTDAARTANRRVEIHVTRKP